MNWDESQMASSAFAQGSGGMSLGEQWAFAAFLRDCGNSEENAEAVERKKTVWERIEEDRKRRELSGEK